MDDLKQQLEAILHLNGCQQRTAGYNDALTKKDIDVEDMERLEKQTLKEVIRLVRSEIIKARTAEVKLRGENDI